MAIKYMGRMLVVAVILGMILLSGFVPMTSAGAPVRDTTAKVLKIGINKDIQDFNYFDYSNTEVKNVVIGWNFESIMGVDYDGNSYPLLAESVDFDSSTLTATIHLRDNVTFQDGQPMTAADVIFSYCALRQGTSASGGITLIGPFDDNNDGIVSFSEIQNHVKYVDAYTLKISSRHPYAQFFLKTLGIPIIPEHIWKNHLMDSGDGQGTSVDSMGYTHGVVDMEWKNDPNATIGTGPWMYAGGVKNSYRIEKPYAGYWGKNFRTPMGYPTWNPNISEIVFKIYKNKNVGVMALQTGMVDYLAWGVSHNTAKVLESDSNIRLHYLPDRGYYYLAFDEKQEPTNYIAFRHAVSHVIDKMTAVRRYLGGFGMAGDSTEPPFFDAWYNASVQHYPYDINTARKILDGMKVVADNGFVEQDPSWGEKFLDVDDDGWRDLPDGSPMPPITLFTPPVEYDPVRIKVGQGIAQNLRSIGVNIQAEPVNFDTLVAYMQSYNYVMLELGWSLNSGPIGNLADIYGPHSAENTWGWWNNSNPNPYYNNAGGVSGTRADRMSQDYATQFENVINKAKSTFDVNTQIKYIKWAQGIISKATVVNVLYYVENIEATRNTWSGWIEWQGTVFNRLSLGILSPAQNANNFKIYPLVEIPEHLTPNKNLTGKVVVINNEGMKLKNAKVTITTSSSSVSIFPTSGETDENGVFYYHIIGEQKGNSVVTFSISYDNISASTSDSVYVEGLRAIYISASADKMSLSPGGSAQIAVKAVDQDGQPVGGATVSVARNIISFGSVTPASATTDTNGIATFTYTAPSVSDMATRYRNMHAIGKLLFSVSKSGYNYSNEITMQLVTYNNNTSDWHIYQIVNVSSYVVSPSLGYTVYVNVSAKNANGTPLSNEYIPVSYSNSTYIFTAPSQVKTNSSGVASFAIMFKDSGLSTMPIYIDFRNTSLLNCVSDRLDILYYDGTHMPSTPLFGGLIQMTDTFINNSTNFTVYLYNETGQPAAVGPNASAANVPIAVVVSGTTDGQLVNLDDKTNNADRYFNSAWYYTGIGIYTPYDNIATSGDFIGHANETPNPYDDDLSTADETGVKPALLHNGSVTIGLPLAEESYRDLRFDVYVVPYGDVYLYIADPEWNFWQFNITGQQVFHSQAVVSRGMNILITSISTDYITTAGHRFNVSSVVYNQENQPVNNITVKAYNHIWSSRSQFHTVSNKSDENGRVVLSPVAPNVTTPSVENVYIKAVSNSTTYSVLEATQIIDAPNAMYFEDVHLNESSIIWFNDTSLSVTGRLMGENGPLYNQTVSLMINGVIVSSNVTDKGGNVTIHIDPKNYSGVTNISIVSFPNGYYGAEENIQVFITAGIIHFAKIQYPTVVGVDSYGNITVVINSTFDVNTVNIFIKYGNNSLYVGYAMHRVNNTNVYYLSDSFDKAGNYTFYIVAVDVHHNQAISDYYIIQASSTVPEFNAVFMWAIVLLIVILVGIERKNKHF